MKYLEISKELLSVVLKDKLYLLIDENFTYSIVDNYVLFAEDECVIFEINIYEFAFKCKEWAFKQGYELHTNIIEVIAIFKEVSNMCNHGHFERLPLKSWQEIEYNIETNSEVEAIIKACEWILEKEIQEENRLQLQEDLTEYNKLIKEGL